MVDDNFGQGMGYLLLFIGFFLVVFGSIELTVIYTLMKRTTNRIIHQAIPAVMLLAGFLLLMRFDASLLIFGSLLLVAPMAALIPPLVIPSFTNPESGLDRILICYIFVSIFTAVLLFTFSWSGLSMVPEVFWHTPLSNAVIFTGVFVLDSLVAFFIYRIMQAIRPAHPSAERKTS
jgi:hypothetical protein